MSNSRLIKHNPAFLSKEELLSSFVVRNRELGLLLEIVRNNTGPVNQHVIIIAPRGMGKTMLVRRLALEIQQDETLSQNWYPVPLPEELYDVAVEGELWLRVLQWVGEQEKENDDGRLLEKHAALVRERNEQTLKIRTLSALSDFAGRKRLLIIVENLQLLLGEQSSEDDAWDIRQTLLNRPELMLVATATTHFGEILNAQKANFELFREICLTPLDTTACRTLWQSITGEDLKENRVRPVEILTGGSPRLLAILADFGAGRPLKELMDNLVVLIDDHTTYFKANVEALPNKERRVFVTLAELWAPSRAKDVAERSRLNVNMVSALLNRLTVKGAVAQVDRKGRTYFYQITERLYNIYHLMRLSGSAGDRVKALVRCMMPIYGEAAVACALAKETCDVDRELRPWFIKEYGSILEQTRQEVDLFQSIVKNTPQAFFELPEANYLKPLVREGVTHEDSMDEGSLLIKKSADSLSGGKFTEAINACNQLVERFGESEDARLLEQVAMALVNKGYALRAMGRPEDEMAAYDSVVKRFGESEDARLLERVAKALVNKGYALRAMGRPEEAVAAYDSVVERFGESEDARLLEPVATALVNKGCALGAMGRPEEAVAAYDSVVERFGESEDPRLLEPVAKAHNDKAWTIYQQKIITRLDAAIQAAANAVRLFPNNNHFRHTLASVYSLAGRWSEAFEQAVLFADDSKLIENCPDEIMNFFISAAAAGKAEAALKTIQKTAAVTGLEPLVAALKISAGADFQAPKEVMEVALDIVKKIGNSGGTIPNF